MPPLAQVCCDQSRTSRGELRGVAGPVRVLDRLVRDAGVGVPAGRATVELRHQRGLLAVQLGAQQVAQEGVAPEAVAVPADGLRSPRAPPGAPAPRPRSAPAAPRRTAGRTARRGSRSAPGARCRARRRPASTSVRRYSRMNRSSPVNVPVPSARSAIPASDTATGQPSVRSSSSAVAVGERVIARPGEHLRGLVGIEGQLGDAELQQVARGAQARDRQAGPGPGRDADPPRVGQPVDDVGQHVEARRRGDHVHAVDEQGARRVGVEGLHEARDGDDARSCAGGAPERGQQRGGVVVGVGARVPHRRARQPVRPLAQDRRLAVPGPGDDGDDACGRRHECVDQPTAGDQPDPRAAAAHHGVLRASAGWSTGARRRMNRAKRDVPPRRATLPVPGRSTRVPAGRQPVPGRCAARRRCRRPTRSGAVRRATRRSPRGRARSSPRPS